MDVLIGVSPGELSCNVSAVKEMKNFDRGEVMLIETLGGLHRSIRCL